MYPSPHHGAKSVRRKEERMADQTKHNEHVVRGSIPKDEWEKFLKAHFKPSEPAVAPARSRAAALGTTICGWLGCPGTHPISGTALKGCRVVTDSHGGVEIHCDYEEIERR